MQGNIKVDSGSPSAGRRAWYKCGFLLRPGSLCRRLKSLSRVLGCTIGWLFCSVVFQVVNEVSRHFWHVLRDAHFTPPLLVHAYMCSRFRDRTQ